MSKLVIGLSVEITAGYKKCWHISWLYTSSLFNNPSKMAYVM